MFDPALGLLLTWSLVAIAAAWAFVCHKRSKSDMAIIGFVAAAGLVLTVPAATGTDYSDGFLLLSVSCRKLIYGVTIACFGWAAMLLVRRVAAVFLGVTVGALILIGLRLGDAPAWWGVAVWIVLCFCLFVAKGPMRHRVEGLSEGARMR